MGTEITHRYFEAEDFSRFRERLDAETLLLRSLFEKAWFSERGDVAGFELEAWLVDRQGNPLPANDKFLERLKSPLVVPELALFNIELNGSPSALTGRVFTRLHDELAATWARCMRVAEELDCHLLTIGTLPSANENVFVAGNMSGMVRYKSLNDRIMALRDGRKLIINIDGDDSLTLEHGDVMLEAAATSFQIHLQCRPAMAVRDFNASLVAAAPLVAVAANAPYLFGHALWDDSRIPLFEQSVDVGRGNEPRVSFGKGYVNESLFEIFEENQTSHSLLVPMVHDTPPNQFSHLRFQNGTVWRWVRPLVGFDFDGQVHLRIEQRVASAGPTLVDSIANSAFYFGLVRGFGLSPTPPESWLSFPDAVENFYKAARYGLGARLVWKVGNSLQEIDLRKLIFETLLPMAKQGLESVNIPNDEIDTFLGIIAARTDNSQNGAAWQRRWLARNQATMNELVLAYREQQDSNEPVHTWAL